MNASDDSQLIGTLIDNEGSDRYAYQDSRGYLTIGIGRCIDHRVRGCGLTDVEQVYLLKNDIADCRRELSGKEFYDNQDQVRKDALVEICFNMGLPNLLLFHDALEALTEKNYIKAVAAFRLSKWATEISPSRMNDLMHRIGFGKY